MSLALRPRLSSAAFWFLAAIFGSMLLHPTCVQAQAEGEKSGSEASSEASASDENDPTKDLLKQLTIAMTSEVLDERTLVIRNTGDKAGNKYGTKKELHLRLGNTGVPPKGSLEDGEYAEKVKVAKDALEKLANKQMIWWKAAPDSLQPPAKEDGEPDVVIADVWSIDGKCLSCALKQDGHLAEVKEYEHDLNKDILTVASEIEKKESYKKLEEALKESEEAKKAMAKKQREEEKAKEDEENVESFGLGGWIGIVFLVGTAVAAFFNFGKGSRKKQSMNRKKGTMEKMANSVQETVAGLTSGNKQSQD